MFDELRFRRRLRKLQKDRARALQEPSKKITEAEAAKDEDEKHEWIVEYSMVRDGHDERIGYLVTRRLREQAERYMIPLPGLGDEGMWEQPKYSRGSYLTDAGVTHMRSLIREHEKHERERWGFWVGSATGLIGTIVALLGLLVAYAALLKSP